MIKEGRKDAEEGTEKEKKSGREKRVEGNSCGNTARERCKDGNVRHIASQWKDGKTFPHSRTGEFIT